MGAQLVGVDLGRWNELIRRARIGRERKLVALVFSSYAATDGTSIYCGVARLAVDCEIGYSTARRYLAWLREVGLIELVRRGNRKRGRSDEYRLILAPDLLEHLDLPDPTTYKDLRDGMLGANRAGQKRRRNQRSPGGPDREHQRLPRVSADGDPVLEESALAQGERRSAYQRSPETPLALAQGEPPPSITTYPELPTFHESRVTLPTDVAVSRARDGAISAQQPPSANGTPPTWRDLAPYGEPPEPADVERARRGAAAARNALRRSGPAA